MHQGGIVYSHRISPATALQALIAKAILVTCMIAGNYIGGSLILKHKIGIEEYMNNTLNIPVQYTDAEVIERVLQGNTALFEILIRRYNALLYKTGRAYGFNHQDTEDLMQETYVNAYQHLRKLESLLHLKPG